MDWDTRARRPCTKEPVKRFLEALDEKKCADATIKLTRAVAAYQKAATQCKKAPDEIAAEITSPTETLALANATMIEFTLGNALIADDETTREDCKKAASDMIREQVPETAIHPRLLGMALAQIGQR